MSKQLAEQATTPASLRWRDLIRRKDDGAGEIHRPAQANLRTTAPGDEASETVNSMSSGSVPRFRRVRLTFAALRRCQIPLLHERCERSLEVRFSAGFQNVELQPQSAR